MCLNLGHDHVMAIFGFFFLPLGQWRKGMQSGLRTERGSETNASCAVRSMSRPTRVTVDRTARVIYLFEICEIWLFAWRGVVYES